MPTITPLTPEQIAAFRAKLPPAYPRLNSLLDGSVTEIRAALAGINNADTIRGLIDAETAGKTRKGAIAALEARLAEIQEAPDATA